MTPRDPEYKAPAAKTSAEQFRSEFRAVSASRSVLTEDAGVVPARPEPTPDIVATAEENAGDEPEDVFETYVRTAIREVAQNEALLKKIRESGETCFNVRNALAAALPHVIENRNDEAHRLVPRFLDEVFRKDKWTKGRWPSKSNPGGTTAWIVLQ